MNEWKQLTTKLMIKLHWKKLVKQTIDQVIVKWCSETLKQTKSKFIQIEKENERK